jgi:hypothetical protein
VRDRPLAIDLFCGLASVQAEIFSRADATINQLVACRAENPHHVRLRVFHQSPSAFACVLGAMGNFQDPVLAARLTCLGHLRPSTSQAIKRLVLTGPCRLVRRAAFSILAARPEPTQFASCFRGAAFRAVALIRIRWRDEEVSPAAPAISSSFRDPFVLLSANTACAARAVTAAPLFVRSCGLERDAA